jgi:hypothetical protein
MDDPFFVRFLECCRDLLRNRECFVERNRVARNAVSECLTRHEFHDQEVSSVDFFDAVDARDVGMIQGCQHARFTLKSRDAFAVCAETFRKEFNGDTALKLRVRRLIDVTRSTGSQMAVDFVVCELVPIM